MLVVDDLDHRTVLAELLLLEVAAGIVSDFKDLIEDRVRLCLARARVLVAKLRVEGDPA